MVRRGISQLASSLWHGSHVAAPTSWVQLLAQFSTSASKQELPTALQEGAITACLSDTRAVVRIHGTDALQYLQGMVTNDVKPLGNPGAGPVYAALLTPKGKFLHDLFLYQQPDGALLMEVCATGKDRALDWLTRYKLRKKVELEDVSEDFSVWTCFGGSVHNDKPGWWPDPRLAALGLRTVIQTDRQRPDTTGTSINSSISQQDAQQLYKQWRYMHGVAEGEAEIPTEKAAPLEYNMDVLNGVSYKKGCYIGQERNSFTHYRGIIKRRCMPFKVQQPPQGMVHGYTPVTNSTPVMHVAPTGQGSQVVSAQEAIVVEGSEEVAGTVQGVAGDVGLAHIRLKQALQATSGNIKLVGSQSRAQIVPFRPGWWPDEWGHEEDAIAAAQQ